jgi:hypothetical protein
MMFEHLQPRRIRTVRPATRDGAHDEDRKAPIRRAPEPPLPEGVPEWGARFCILSDVVFHSGAGMLILFRSVREGQPYARATVCYYDGRGQRTGEGQDPALALEALGFALPAACHREKKWLAAREKRVESHGRRVDAEAARREEAGLGKG